MRAFAGHEKSEKTGPKKGWAQLMRRVFGIDVLECPRCRSQMQMISFITETKAIRDILASIGLATAPPEPARASAISQQEHFSFDYAE